MYLQLRQEMSQLKQDRSFVRNLGFTAIVAVACSFTFADLQANSTKISERNSTPSVTSTRTAIEIEPFFR